MGFGAVAIISARSSTAGDRREAEVTMVAEPSKGWLPDTSGPLGGSAQSGGFRTTDLDNSGAFLVEPAREAWGHNGNGNGETQNAAFVLVPTAEWPADGDPRDPLSRGFADPITANESRTYTHEGTIFRTRNVVFDTSSVVGFQSTLGSRGGDAFEGVSPTMRIGGNGAPPPAVSISGTNDDGIPEVCGTIADGAHHGGGLNGQDASRVRILPVFFNCYQRTEADVSSPLATACGGVGGGVGGVRHGAEVRRLTPLECERLQGFPDDYTLIPYRGKPAADGNRYKALGNSMAVNVMRWLGDRIAEVDRKVRE